jgi:hypothetical protein
MHLRTMKWSLSLRVPGVERSNRLDRLIGLLLRDISTV